MPSLISDSPSGSSKWDSLVQFAKAWGPMVSRLSGDAHQRGAAVKGRLSDLGHGIGHRHGPQLGKALEGVRGDGRHRVAVHLVHDVRLGEGPVRGDGGGLAAGDLVGDVLFHNDLVGDAFAVPGIVAHRRFNRLRLKPVKGRDIQVQIHACIIRFRRIGKRRGIQLQLNGHIVLALRQHGPANQRNAQRCRQPNRYNSFHIHAPHF